MYSHKAMLEELRAVADGAEHVRVDRQQMEKVAPILNGRLGAANYGLKRPVPALEPDALLQYYMVAGAHNFLFWDFDESKYIGVDPSTIHVKGQVVRGAATAYACHHRAARQDKKNLDSGYLASMTLADTEDYYRDEKTGNVALKLIAERQAKFNETGRVLREKYDGSFVNLLERADGWLFRDDGEGVVQQLVKNFPLSYGDWPYCKLIMVTLGNLYESINDLFPEPSRSRELIDFKDQELLEVGADYYRPYFLYRVGILRISEAFKERLLNRQLLPVDSQMEQEYRAWTILATREMADLIGRSPHELARETWAMAYMRCRPCYVGVPEEEVPCSYRPICHSYNVEVELMRAPWPLVYTDNY
jgi:hypothetical protein